MATLGQILKFFRITATENLGQTAVAQKIGLSEPYISGLESNKKNPTLETLQKLSQYYRVPVSEFFRIEEVSNKNNFSSTRTFLEVVKTYLKYNESDSVN